VRYLLYGVDLKSQERAGALASNSGRGF
jgi:hypothetical protein